MAGIIEDRSSGTDMLERKLSCAVLGRLGLRTAC